MWFIMAHISPEGSMRSILLKKNPGLGITLQRHSQLPQAKLLTAHCSAEGPFS